MELSEAVRIRLNNLLKQYNADVSICNFYTVSQEKIAIKNADNGINQKEILLNRDNIYSLGRVTKTKEI